MATGSLMMGTLKGKLGETVAMRRNGKQVVRAYISNPKNPNSQKQQVQRMVQATAAQAYSAMKKICDHSFEGVQVGQKSMSYFMSKNMDYLRASIAANADGTLLNASADYVRKGVNLPVLNRYVVAKGTLPEVQLLDASSPNIANFEPSTMLLLSELSVDGSAPRGDVVLDSFLRANSAAAGDWFTFLFLLQENGNSQNGQPVYRFGFVRFVIDEVDDTLGWEATLTNFGKPAVEGWNPFGTMSGSTEDSSAIFVDVADIFLNIGTKDGQLTPVAYAVIHSRQNVGGSWQRSNAEFVIRDNWDALGITYPSDFEGALATYSGAGEAKGTGDYVLNGGV